MEQSLQNQIALVTGGGGWIANAIITTILQAGAEVYLIDHDVQALQAVMATHAHTAADKLRHCIANVIDEIVIQDIITNIEIKHGRLDILIHTAAIYPRTFIHELTVAEWQTVITTNLTGSFICLKHSCTLMKKNYYCRIFLFCSTTGEIIGTPGFAHYSASKSGVLGLMKTAAIELAPFGITVNTISPGNIINEPRYQVSPKNKAAMLNVITVGRLGLPQDVAQLSLFLATQAAGFLTGQSFIIDGGETIMPHTDYVTPDSIL